MNFKYCEAAMKPLTKFTKAYFKIFQPVITQLVKYDRTLKTVGQSLIKTCTCMGFHLIILYSPRIKSGNISILSYVLMY